MDQATQNTLRNTDNGNTIAQATAATLETLMMTTLDTQRTQVGYLVCDPLCMAVCVRLQDEFRAPTYERFSP